MRMKAVLRLFLWLRSLGAQRAALYGIALGAVIEAFTLAGRYLGDVQVTRDTEWIARFTFGYRIHHGYPGVLLLLLALFLSRRPAWRNAALILGIGLVLSDALHHFVFLWAIEGDPEFHLTYGDRH